LVDITADSIEMYLRDRLRQRVRVRVKLGYRQLGAIKATTIHQEFRVLRRMLNVAVRKKLLAANPCPGVEFPVAAKGLFRPHYVAWSEQLKIESHGPHHLRNIVRIITETGLRIYKELTPMRKDQVDLQNATVWIPDSKTPNGVAEVPLTFLAIEALKSQMALSGMDRSSFRAIGIPVDTRRNSRPFGKKLSDGPRFPTFGFTTFVPPTPPGSVPAA
jgi:integrase